MIEDHLGFHDSLLIGMAPYAVLPSRGFHLETEKMPYL
jgi:hypothetical protein